MPEMSTLDRLEPGQTARVKKVGGNGAIRRRILDMGLTNGVQIEMVRTSPLGDPIEYKLRGYHLSLRKEEASQIDVEIKDA
jgi:Fe2+ transport system protein FeoA